MRVLRQPALGEGRASRACQEGQYDELLNFESADGFDERQKAALAYAEAIAWGLDTDDAFWERMHAHFSEPELVELGCMIGLTLGQQSWLRLLNIEHHEVMPGDRASMAPGVRDRRGARGKQGVRGVLGSRLTGNAREQRGIALGGAATDAEGRRPPGGRPPRDGVARAEPGAARPDRGADRAPGARGGATRSATGRTRWRAACGRAGPGSSASSCRISPTR